MLKTAQMPVFLLGVLLPETKNIINIVGLGFRGKKISVFTVLFAPRIWK